MRRATVIGLACVMAMALAGNALAQDKVTIKKGFVPGNYKQSVVTSTDGKTKVGDNEIANKSEMTMAMLYKVAAPDKDGNTVATLQFTRFAQSVTAGGQTYAFDTDKPDASTMPPGTGVAEMFTKLVKAVITITAGADGKVKEVTGLDAMWDEMAKADPKMADQINAMKKSMGDAMVKGMIEKQMAGVPDKPVGVGDTWSTDLPMDVPMVGKLSVKSTYTLKALEDSNKTAVIDVKGKIETAAKADDPNAAAAMKMDMDITGAMKVTVNNPLIASGEVTTTQKIQNAQMTSEVTTKSTIKMEKVE